MGVTWKAVKLKFPLKLRWVPEGIMYFLTCFASSFPHRDANRVANNNSNFIILGVLNEWGLFFRIVWNFLEAVLCVPIRVKHFPWRPPETGVRKHNA